MTFRKALAGRLALAWMLAAAWLAPSLAPAQTPPASVQNSAGIYVPVDPVFCLSSTCSGGGGGGSAPFVQSGNATLAVTSASSRVALGSADQTVVVRNTGSADAAVVFGSASVVATLAGTPVPAGSVVQLSANNQPDIAAITASGSASLQIITGTGTPAFSLAGGGGGGSGGAVTAAASSYASGAFSSGAFAAGSISAGAAALGSFLSGSVVDLGPSAPTGSAGANIACLAAGTCPSSTLSIPPQVSEDILIGIIGDLIGSTTSGQHGPLAQCAATTSAPTYTTGKTEPQSCDLAGNGRTTTQGPTPTSAAFAANPLPGGGEALSAEPAAGTTGHPVPVWCDLVGKCVTSPYAPRELYLRGAANTTANTATTLIAAQGAGVKIYVVGVQCFRTDAGTTPIIATLDDSVSTVVGVPNAGNGGGNNPPYTIPLVVAANTALTFTFSSAVTTGYCNAQGFSGY